MSLDTTFTDITTKLRQGKFPNEQSISQTECCTAESDETPSTCTATSARCHGSRFRGSRGLRVLQELGWDTWDTAVVWPEYQTGQGRADFALCHPPSKPAIFIEVKQPGKAEHGFRQALE